MSFTADSPADTALFVPGPSFPFAEGTTCTFTVSSPSLPPAGRSISCSVHEVMAASEAAISVIILFIAIIVFVDSTSDDLVIDESLLPWDDRDADLSRGVVHAEEDVVKVFRRPVVACLPYHPTEVVWEGVTVRSRDVHH